MSRGAILATWHGLPPPGAPKRVQPVNMYTSPVKSGDFAVLNPCTKETGDRKPQIDTEPPALFSRKGNGPWTEEA